MRVFELVYNACMKIPYSLRIAGFCVGLVILTIVLKATCPVQQCFVDPFLRIVFSPLWLAEATGVSRSNEPLFLVWVWCVVGGCAGALADIYRRKN